MICSFKDRKALKRILTDNKGKIELEKGPLGHYWFDAREDVSFNDLILPEELTYKRYLYDDNGGGQFLILNAKEKQLGRINTYRR